MTSWGASPAERNDTVNNQQQQQLEKLRKKWNLDCKTAVKNKVSYVLRRSRSDYLKVVGSDKGLDSYQAKVLDDISGVGTHRQVAIFERHRVADIIRDAFKSVEPDTVTGMIGAVVIEEVLGDVVGEAIVSVSPEVLVTRSEDTIENYNPMSGAVPGPVSARSSVSLQSADPVGLELGYKPRVANYVVDPASPTNIYTRDMLKSMGYSDPVRAEEDDFGTGNYSRRLRLALEAGSKKARSLNWKKVGAVTGTMSAVALVSLGTSLSAYAAVDSDDLYQRFHTTYSDTGKSQSLKVSANSQPPAVIDRMKDIYKPDMIWPTVDGSGVFISSGFGYRSAPCSACSSDHRGIDMNPGYGTEVYSSTAGTVVSVGWDGSLGWDVTIQDEGNRQYVYGHMIEGSTPADVVVGAKVKQGQVIGLVGNTGLSTGAHLHFEIHEDGVKINPYPELLKYAH
jgi:murein DD-endopeptidase MepM/ murein hydrolase activator NlpD